jgi:hypothetical protein
MRGGYILPLHVIIPSTPPDNNFRNIIIDRILQSVQNVDPIATAPHLATPFHALSVPNISLQRYMDRFVILKFIYCLEDCFGICCVRESVTYLHLSTCEGIYRRQVPY